MFIRIIKWFEKHNKISWISFFLTAGVIFYFSSLSFEWMAEKPNTGIKAIIYHIFIFFLLACFLFTSVVKGKEMRFIGVPIIIAFIYGVLDEFHQIFTPGRFASVEDIFLDGVGIFFAFLVYSISIRYRMVSGGE